MNSTGICSRSRVRPWIISRVLIAHTCFGRNGGLAPVSLPLFQGVRVRAVKRQLSLSVMILLLGYWAEEHAVPAAVDVRNHVSFQTVAIVRPKPDRIGSVANDPQRTSPLLSGCKMPVERN